MKRRSVIIVKNLLSEKDERLLQLTELVYKEEGLLIRDICVSLNMTNKTLKTDIERANELFSPIEILETGKGGLKLVIPKNYSIAYIYNCFLLESKEFNILEKLLFCEQYSVDNLAEDMYISSSSLRRIIKKMNSVLKEEEMEIKLNPLKLIGNEIKIINFYIHYLIECYPLNKDVFSKNQVKAVGNLVDYLTDTNNIVLDFFSKERIEIFLLIKLIRIKHGHFFETIVQQDSRINFSALNNTLILKKIENAFRIKVDEQLLLQLFRPFLNGRFCFSYQQLKDSSFINPEVHETILQFECLLENVTREYQIKLSKAEKEQVMVHLCNIRMLQYGKPFILYDHISEVIQYFSKDYSEGMYFILKQIKRIFENEFIEDYELNNYMYVLLTHLEKYFIKMENQFITLNLGIVYYADENHTKMIKEEVDYRFNDKFNTTIVTGSLHFEQILKNIEKNNYDVIITNLSTLSVSNTEVLCFQIYPTEEDWSELLAAYNLAKLTKKIGK